MSGVARRRETIAPSLFPFLAVLLCTMGALVLILMLIVSTAQASAQQAEQAVRERAEEIQSAMELATSSYERQLADGRLDLEQKRLALQHFEDHIFELLSELEELQRQAAVLDNQDQDSEEQRAAREQAISELEKQLAEAREDLQQKLAEPDGDKPIFAIIPYQGTNGTHRRPIYLECVQHGVLIQPEGILLSVQDLAPPHGPGNPLDAALRTIRSEFEPASRALTQTAYPLLIVRPDGVRTYALARAAMSGWDDQFGYELIAQDLELAFPESKPGLAERIAQSIRLARERQAALVAAMPQKYGRLDDFGAPRPAQGGGQGSVSRAFGNAGTTTSGDFSMEPGGFATSNPGSQPGGFADSTAASTFANSDESSFGAPFSSPQNGQGFSDRGQLARSTAAGSAGTFDAYSPEAMYGGASAPGELNFFGPNAAMAGDATGSMSGGSPASNLGSLQATSEGEPGGQDSGVQDAGGQSSAGQNSGDPTTAGGAAAAGPSNPSGSSSGQAGSSMNSTAQQAGQDPNQPGLPQVSLDGMQDQRSRSTTPVAQQRGRNWAWSAGRPTQTPVVRAVHLHCFRDRWVLLPEEGSPDKGVTITADLPPQRRAEILATAIGQRVDSWGLALLGGYWKPVIVVDVAPDAQWRLTQLKRLMDGSGIEVQQRQRSPRKP